MREGNNSSLLGVFLGAHTSPPEAGTQGMCWFTDVKAKLRRFLLYASNKFSSSVSCSLNFSCSNWVFTPFYPFSPAWSQFIPKAQRSCLISTSLHISRESLERCELRKRCRAAVTHSNACMTERGWRMQPWYFLHIPTAQTSFWWHPSPWQVLQWGAAHAQTKSTHSSSNLRSLGSTALHSEPKQSVILNKPVIEKSTFVPFSKTVSPKEI